MIAETAFLPDALDRAEAEDNALGFVDCRLSIVDCTGSVQPRFLAVAVLIG